MQATSKIVVRFLLQASSDLDTTEFGDDMFDDDGESEFGGDDNDGSELDDDWLKDDRGSATDSKW